MAHLLKFYFFNLKIYYVLNSATQSIRPWLTIDEEMVMVLNWLIKNSYHLGLGLLNK